MAGPKTIPAGIVAGPKPTNGYPPDEPPAVVDVSSDDVRLASAVLRAVALLRVRGRTIKAIGASGIWSDLFDAVYDSPSKVSAAKSLDVWLRGEERRGTLSPVIRPALELARNLVAETPDEPDREDAPAPYRLEVLGAEEFAMADYRPEWLVEGVLAKNQPGVLASSKKTMKTMTSTALAVAMASGRDFLDKFPIPRPVPVLFLSGESGGAAIRDAVGRICRSKGIDHWPTALEGRFFIGFDLPALNSPEQVAALGEFIRSKGIGLVIVDPLYLCLVKAAGGTSVEPENLFDMGPLLSAVSRACLDAGATPLLVHHFKKTGIVLGEKPELEHMSFSGIQEYARQWILMSRRARFEPGTGHHELWMVVGGSAGHSGEYAVDIDEGRMDDDWGGRTWEVSVRSSSEAFGELAATTSINMQKRKQAKEETAEKALLDDMKRAYAWLESKGPATKTAWRENLNISGTAIGPIVARLISEGMVAECMVRVPKRGGLKDNPGYRVAGTLGFEGETTS